MALTRRHRVQALVWNSLRPSNANPPSHVAEALAVDAEEIVGRNLRGALECADLHNRFAGAGVPMIFAKGLSLGALAYANPFLKMGWDIDILVSEDAIIRSAALLNAAGYELVEPGARRTGVERWHAHRKESPWRKGPFLVELHSRLADNRRLIPSIGVSSPHQAVNIAPGISLPTLATPELFAYLSIHGASSAWFRLKWICDLAALLAPCSAPQIEQLYEFSVANGAGRAPGQALLLADRLFGTLGDMALKQRLLGDRFNRWLADMAEKQLTGSRALIEPTETRFGTTIIHLTQLALVPGLPFKISELRRQIRDVAANLTTLRLAEPAADVGLH